MNKRLNLKRRYKRQASIDVLRGARSHEAPSADQLGESSAHPLATSGGRSTILLVDDHPVVRQGLCGLISRQANLAVCGEVDTAAEAVEKVQSLKPALVLIDLCLRETSGLDLIKAIQAREPSLPLLVLSMHHETLYAERTLRAGARGYLMKQEASEKILEAIQCVLEGNIYLSDPMKERMLQHMVRGPKEKEEFSVKALSDRELEVFQLMGNGFGTRHIAERLHLSVKTIESYRESLKHKLHLQSGAELVQRAIQWARSENALV